MDLAKFVFNNLPTILAALRQPPSSQHSELADRLDELDGALGAELEQSPAYVADLIKKAAAALRQPPSDAMRTALRKYGRHLSDCDLYANSTRSCTCGLTAALTERKS
jgi:hypothetical protein